METTNISLDTSFFESQNFLVGKGVKAISEMSQEGYIKLFITDIVYREITERICFNLFEADNKLKKIRDSIKASVKVLRNFETHKDYFELPDIKVNELIEKFKLDFLIWLELNKVVIIPTDDITIGSVFKDYFDKKNPFGEGKKKHEFPDAFNLKALEIYFGLIGQKTYVLSLDKDILLYESSVLLPRNDYSDLLDVILRTSKKKIITEVIKFVEVEFMNNRYNLLSIIESKLFDAIEEEIETNGYVEGEEIINYKAPKLSLVDLDRLSILSIDEENETAILECEVSFSYNIIVTIYDYGYSYYDKEDDRYYNIEEKDVIFEGDEVVPVSLAFDFDLGRKIGEFKIEEINRSEKFGFLNGRNIYR